jgi:hypothetical protein
MSDSEGVQAWSRPGSVITRIRRPITGICVAADGTPFLERRESDWLGNNEREELLSTLPAGARLIAILQGYESDTILTRARED